MVAELVSLLIIDMHFREDEVPHFYTLKDVCLSCIQENICLVY